MIVANSGAGSEGVTGLVSVIVTTHERPDALGAVLDALARQDVGGFEVVIADDGSGAATAARIAQAQADFPVRLAHVWQPHRGFRAGEARNRALRASGGAYVVFLDGDCLPRRDFIAQHRRLAEPGWFVAGNRTLLSGALTARILDGGEDAGGWPLGLWMRHRRAGDANRIAPLLRLPLGRLRKLRPRAWRGARSCNLAVWRRDLDAVDGFDAAFTGWGREDSDLLVRLLNAGVRRKDGSFATGVLHLWHPSADLARLPANDDLLARVIAAKAIRAAEGVSTLSDDDAGPGDVTPATRGLLRSGAT